jgi:hypothetical protein
MSINLSNLTMSKVSARTTTVAPPAPTVLLTETWLDGSGLVDGKVPTTGGGTWIAPNGMSYNSGMASPDTSFRTNTAFHSTTYTNVRFSGAVTSGTTGPSQNHLLFIYARASANNSASSDCYYVICSAIPASIFLRKRVGGVDTTLNTFSADTANGETVGLQISGSAIKVYYNGAIVISATDTSIIAAGYWGFGLTYGEVGEVGGNSSMGAITIQTA